MDGRRSFIKAVGGTVIGTATVSSVATAENTLKVRMSPTGTSTDYTIKTLGGKQITGTVTISGNESHSIPSGATIDKISLKQTGNAVLNYNVSVDPNTTPEKDKHRFELRGNRVNYNIDYNGALEDDYLDNLEPEDGQYDANGVLGELGQTQETDSYQTSEGRLTEANFLMKGGKITYERL